MKFRLGVLALAGAMMLSSYAHAQTFPSGYVQGNSGATAAPPRPADARAVLHRALGCSDNAIVAIVSGSIGCVTIGTDLQGYDADLQALANNSTNGLWARTGAGTGAARTITGTANEISVSNGDGGSGNPTLSLPSALTFTGKTVTGGTYSSPTLSTPTLGIASATSINKVAITAPTSGATLTIPDGVTLTGPASSGTVMTLGNAETVTGTKSFNSGTVKLNGSSSGSGSLVPPAAASTYIWTLPPATDTLVGKATPDTFTNKTFDTAGTGNSFSINGLAATANTGTGAVVRATSPSLTTPTLGVASATSINKVAITAPASGSTLTIADGKTATFSNTLTFTGTDSSSVAFGAGGTVAYTGNNLSAFASTTSSQLAGVLSDETGSGKAVFDTSPTISSPTISGHATIEGVTLTGATGTGKAVFDTSPALTGTLDIQQAVKLTGSETVSQITSDQDDWAVSNFSTRTVLRISSDAARNITGVAGGAAGIRKLWCNVGSFTITFKDGSSSSTASNRFDLGADLELGSKSCQGMIYDGVDSRWRAESPAGGGGGGGSGTVTSVSCNGTAITTSGTCTPSDQSLFEAIVGMNQAKLLAAPIMLGSRFADSFSSGQLGQVDVAGATNLDPGTAGLLKNTTGSDTYSTTVDPSLTSNVSGYGGYTVVQRVSAAAMSTDGDKVRITLTPASSGNNTVINKVYIGKAGTAPSFDGNQVQVLFSGNANVTLSSGGSSVVSDPVTFAFDHTADILIAIEFGATTDVRRNASPGSNYNLWEKAAAAEAANTSKSGYTNDGAFIFVLDKIEVRTAAGTVNNVTVASTSITAASEPSNVGLALRVKEVDALTLNSGGDFECWVSRDGTTSTSAASVTLVKKLTGIDGIAVYESDDVNVSGQSSGTSMKWSCASHNNKRFEMHDVYMRWQ